MDRGEEGLFLIKHPSFQGKLCYDIVIERLRDFGMGQDHFDTVADQKEGIIDMVVERPHAHVITHTKKRFDSSIIECKGEVPQ